MNTSEKILFDNRIKRKNVLALNEKVAAIREFEKTPVYKHVGRSFNCSPDQIKRIIQQKDEILKAWEQRTRRCNEVKSLEMKSVRVSMLGKSVYEWIRRMMYYKDFIITDGLIQKMALQFKSALGIQVFFPHQDWCDKFRQMYKISDNDTKKLKIAYAQGHSVQIKDIIRDILVPEHEANEESSTKPTQYGTDNESNASGKEEEEADANEEDEEEEEDEEKYEPPPQRPKRHAARKQANQTKSKPTSSPAPAKPALAKRHLVAVKLPLGTTHTNGAKLPQQVLVATPINAGANRTGATPMTMTIIPLASVAQSLNSTRPQLPNDKPIVPPPKLEIKREIEEDEPLVAIKKEYISDEEEEENMPTKNETHETMNCNEQEKENATNSRLATTQNTEIARTDNEQSEEEDNLALAQLQKGLTSKSQTTTISTNINDSTNADTPNTWPAEPNSPHSLPAMPPLTRAPTAINSTSSNKRRHAHYDRTPTLPPISSCAEARKYLKLLEDFALVKENFRLIGLITRADEVLRELDGDDDVDVV